MDAVKILDRSRQGPSSVYWLGLDDRGIELEIVALDLADAVVVIHVMPTTLRKGGQR